MAKITGIPAMAIVSGFKGVLDFFVHDGIACVRRWPRPPTLKRSAAVQAQWPAWRYATTTWINVSKYVQDAYRATATIASLTGRDLYVKAFIKDYFREGQWDALIHPPERLDDFPDVDVPSPEDNQVLVWREGAGKWKPE